jgi:hypothetical protein
MLDRLMNALLGTLMGAMVDTLDMYSGESRHDMAVGRYDGIERNLRFAFKLSSN